MRKRSVLLLAGLLLLVVGFGIKVDFLKLHQEAIVVDTHVDTLQRVVRGADLGTRSDQGHVDIPRLREGGVDLEFFAVWVSPEYLPKSPDDPDSSAWRAHLLIDALYDQARKHPDDLAVVTNYREAMEAIKAGKIAAALGIEGGHAIENSLEKLEEFYKRGVRYLSLTWENSTDWATSAKDETSGKELPFRGLTEFGKKVIRKMNELGMLVDISHSGETTFWDVIRTSTKPLIASHSSVYALCPHYRNLKDDQIKAIAEKGGVIMLNFYAGYLDSTYERQRARIMMAHRAELQEIRRKYRDHFDLMVQAFKKVLGPELEKIRPSVDILIDHIDYIVKLVGPDYVGLGSDFDGISVAPKGLEDISKLPLITKKLLQRGYSEEDIRKILGGNFLRVFKEVCE